ncbi:hypothetical protein OSB04_025865 [Centaurea solstitialis]|uniref:F-box domain-containing protein n=1 Tax=Centaurea solstitialis TaxID=347529 RepID=A0AA38T8C3_9ASTR|nr:hypothetical protein OSB04_025865 [Centaurea solstitialis]
MIEPKQARLLPHRNVPDEVIHNILSRLSPKPLMRFRCVSTYWNLQITESHFKSHRKFLLSDISLYALNGENVYSSVEVPSPFENGHWKNAFVIGTLYGIVILALEKAKALQLILYNPLTREARKLPDPPRSCCISARERHAYGFGYGYEATPDDSKIVIGYNQLSCDCSESANEYEYDSDGEYISDSKYCHVFSLKQGSWTTPKTDFGCANISQAVGVFLNGYLNWLSGYRGSKIIVLDVEEMKFSRMGVPDGTNESSRLGTLHRRLCIVNKNKTGFIVWVLNIERYLHKEWLKRYSFTIGIERDYHCLDTICILEDGRIVLMDFKSLHLIFYDPSKGSQNIFKCMASFTTSGIEYVESLASPSDICRYI